MSKVGMCWGKEPKLGKYRFSGVSMDIAEKILRITGNLNVGTQPGSRVEASPHLVVNLATEVKHCCCSVSKEQRHEQSPDTCIYTVLRHNGDFS